MLLFNIRSFGVFEIPPLIRFHYGRRRPLQNMFGICTPDTVSETSGNQILQDCQATQTHRRSRHTPYAASLTVVVVALEPVWAAVGFPGCMLSRFEKLV